jgi:cyclopropane fatty-acyl-phospholipid synthase-like methyltransferase
MFDLSLYNDEFFEWHVKYAREYSIKTMDWFLDNFNVRSVVDFGAGIGSYLECAHDRGLEVKGYEISETAKKYTPAIIQPFIEYRDCTKPIYTKGYDCVISFETAEHINPEGTQQFIDNLQKATEGYFLFTAAPPGQQGTGHINMHSRAWWIDRFTDLSYMQKTTEVISANWARLGAPKYICDNLIVCTR